jgi:RHS repeat-associated protein
MYEAARVTDGINHTSALAGFIAGALVGIGLIATVAFCTFTCGFGVALVAGLLAGFGAQGALMLGEALGSAFSSPAGTLTAGSSNVFINSLPAAYVQQSTAACDMHPPLPMVAEGSSNIFINSMPAARKDDHITCGAKIGTGSKDVFLGGGRVAYLPFDSEIPEWLRTATSWAFALAGLAGGLAALVKEAGEIGIRALAPCAAKFIAGYVVGSVVGEAVTKYVVAPAISAIVGHPVELTTGRKILLAQDETDFVLNGRLPISCSRFYGSNLNVEGSSLGPGWMHEWDVNLRAKDDTLIHTDAQGRETIYPMVKRGQSIYSAAEQRTLGCTEDGRYFLYGTDEVYYEFSNTSSTPSAIARLCAIENKVGQRIVFERDGFGYLQTIIGSGGERLKMHYQMPLQRLKAVELVEGGTPGILVRYEYEKGQLAAVFNRANEQTRKFSYAHGLMVEHINALGLICKYRWDIIDGTPRVIEHSNSEGEKYTFGYDTKNRESWATDTFGRTARWHYDDKLQVLENIGFDGKHTKIVYNDNGNVTELHLPGERKVAFEYDSLGRLIQETDPLGRVTKHEYHKGSLRETCRTLPDGSKWRASYDPRGLLLTQQDPLGRKTAYEYNNEGLAEAIIDAKGGRKQIEWGSKGRITSYSDCSGKATRYEYDDNGYLIGITDALGQQTRIARAINGNPIGIIRPDGSQEQYQFDDFGLVRTHTNAVGSTRSWERNGRGQVTRIVGGTNRNEEYHYDAHGRLTEIINGNGASYRIEYNQGDRMARLISIDGIEKQYEYDAVGALATINVIGKLSDGQAQQRTTRLVNDLVGRMTARHTDSAITEYEYDELDHLVSVTRQPTALGTGLGIAPDTLKFEYDAAGQLVKEDGAHGTLAYQTDELGYLSQLTLPQGQALHMVRYGSGHTHQIRLDDHLICDIERDDLHREIVRTQGQLTSRFAYDQLGRISWQNSAIGSPDDTIGIGQGQGQLWRNYSYGLQNELTGKNDNLRGHTRYQYDPEGRLLSCRADGYPLEHFAWDNADNLQAPSDGKKSVGASVNNRLTVWQDIRYTYDAFGNVQTKKKGAWQEQTFAYDADDRLIEVSGVTDAGRATTRFAYDALGRRIGKQVIRPPHNGQIEPTTEETRFVWQGMQMVQEINGDAIISYVYDPNSRYKPLARLDQTLGKDGKLSKGNLYHFHTDQIGTPLEVTRNDGSLAWAGQYQAWGKVDGQVLNAAPQLIGSKITQNLRFAGQYADESTGLHYNTFRYYDPDIGRFTSQDPIGLSGGMNLYRYVPNPVAWIDPWGWVGETVPGYNVYGLYAPGSDTPYYVGITDDLKRRAGEHMDSGRLTDDAQMKPITEDVTYGEARGIEQANIEHYGTKTGTIGSDLKDATTYEQRGNKVASFDHNNTTRPAARQTYFEDEYKKEKTKLGGSCCG